MFASEQTIYAYASGNPLMRIDPFGLQDSPDDFPPPIASPSGGPMNQPLPLAPSAPNPANPSDPQSLEQQPPPPGATIPNTGGYNAHDGQCFPGGIPDTGVPLDGWPNSKLPRSVFGPSDEDDPSSPLNKFPWQVNPNYDRPMSLPYPTWYPPGKPRDPLPAIILRRNVN